MTPIVNRRAGGGGHPRWRGSDGRTESSPVSGGRAAGRPPARVRPHLEFNHHVRARAAAAVRAGGARGRGGERARGGAARESGGVKSL